jgi:hypothetical protein
MSKPHPGLVFAIGVAVGGLGMGWWSSPKKATTSAPQPPPVAAAQAPSPRTSPPPRVVCTDVARAPAAELDAVQSRLNWCEARLRAITAPRPTGRLSWPEGVPEAEAPDAWAEQMDELVANCDIPGVPVVTDCEEYPCVTMMRPVGETIGGKALRNRISNCDSRPPALANSNVEAAPVKVTCPDGHQEEALVVSGASPEGVGALYGLEEGDTLEFSDYIVHAGRRVESALALWVCE